MLRTLIDSVAQAAKNNCVLHKYHYPTPARPTELHHIQPKFMHGPDVNENKAPICPTGHDNIHLYIDWLLKHDATTAPHLFHEYDAPLHVPLYAPPPSITRSEKALAIRGYTAWVQAGRPALLGRKAP